MEEEAKTFIGLAASTITPRDDALIWWEGDQIRIDSIQAIAFAESKGLPTTPLYLHPGSPAWAQAAQLADEED